MPKVVIDRLILYDLLSVNYGMYRASMLRYVMLWFSLRTYVRFTSLKWPIFQIEYSKHGRFEEEAIKDGV